MLLSALLCAAAVISSPAVAATGYSITFLDNNGGCCGSAQALNRHGVAVGASNSSPNDGVVLPMQWSGDTLTELPSLGGTSGQAWDVNDAGVVVGEAQLPGDATSHAVLWRDGQATDLGSLGDSSRAFAINKAGVIVGESSPDSTGVYAVRWKAGRLVRLKTLGGSISSAAALNNAGTIVGHAEGLDGNRHPVRWQDGAITELTALGAEGFARDINTDGTIVGSSLVEGVYRATRWMNDVPQDLGALTSDGRSEATAVNDHGRVVGWSDAPGDGFPHAVLWTDRKIVDLNTWLDQPMRDAGWLLVRANAVNNNGDIAGWARNNISGHTRGFVATRQ